jgi:hypothetical protein
MYTEKFLFNALFQGKEHFITDFTDKKLAIKPEMVEEVKEPQQPQELTF